MYETIIVTSLVSFIFSSERMTENGNSDKRQISTFVFMDFESTGLLDSKNRTRITEMCFLAVNRVDMLENSKFPRVTNKLTLFLDPQKPISPIASQMTGN